MPRVDTNRELEALDERITALENKRWYMVNDVPVAAQATVSALRREVKELQAFKHRILQLRQPIYLQDILNLLEESE